MPEVFLRFIGVGVLCCLALPSVTQAQSDPAKLFATNCTLCHGADGSGNTGTGKAMHAKDLRSDDVQKQSDAALSEVIIKGRGKMPAFGAKIKPDDVQKLMAYIRNLPSKK
ncbi:MAG: cytochrome c [Candidatus Sulfotelmatobacter sp.]